MQYYKKIHSVGLVYKQDNAEASHAVQEITRFLQDQSIATWAEKSESFATQFFHLAPVDLILVLGGDGTIISVARVLLGSSIPLAGVNFGRVGFLATTQKADWRSALEQVLHKGILVEERMSLRYVAKRQGEVFAEGEGVNDVVLGRGCLARLMALDLFVDDELFFHLRADGLILSSPTGATGYLGSVNGPLLSPGLDVYAVAPVCPFQRSFAPFVLSHEARFSIHLCHSSVDIFATIDGQELFGLEMGDIIEVHGSPKRFYYAMFPHSSYIGQLHAARLVHL